MDHHPHFSITKYIMPCKYGVRCRYSKCEYWHADLFAIELCPEGSLCETRSCKKSHEMLNPFCTQDGCDMLVCELTHPCKYGITCNKIDICPFDHPWSDNALAIGKSKLLFAASDCAKQLNHKYFDISVLSYSNIKSVVLPDDAMQLPVNFQGFTWLVAATAYTWAENETFQNFANKRLSGGALTLGNVQEEIMMRSLGLLQHLYAGEHNNRGHILSSNLAVNPLLIDTFVVARDLSDRDDYGKGGLVRAAKKDINAFFAPQRPISVKIICVAMYRLPKTDGSSYSTKILQSSLQSLMKCYVTTLVNGESDRNVVSHRIHIGNIGCGAFNHNYNTIFILQRIAVMMSVSIVKPRKHVSVTYHTYDTNTMVSILEHAVPKMEEFTGKSVQHCIEKINELQKLEPQIWAIKL